MAKVENYKNRKICVYQIDGFEIGQDNEWEVVVEANKRLKFAETKTIVQGGLESQALKYGKDIVDTFDKKHVLGL